MSSRGSRALGFALCLSTALALVKYGFGLYTGSLLVLVSAADSFSDALVSGLNYWGYRWARTPADQEHPFGHGKLEGVLATGQGALLIGIAGSVIAWAIRELIEGARLPHAELAAIVILVSTSGSAAMTYALTRAARGDRSTVVSADAAHYRTDLVSGVASFASLIAAGATGWAWLDPVASAAAALWMIKEAVTVIRLGLAELLDEALPGESRAVIDRVLARHRREVVEFHGLKTRRSGPFGFVEVHVVMRPEISLADAHRFVQEVSREIRGELPGTRVMIHPDAAGLRDDLDDALEAGVSGERPS